MSVQCFGCGADVKPSLRFCRACGTPTAAAAPVSTVIERQPQTVSHGGVADLEHAGIAGVETPATGAPVNTGGYHDAQPLAAGTVPAPDHGHATAVDSAAFLGSNAVVNVHMTTPGLVAAPKSMGVALLLTFFFGPLGMLYSTVGGALVMIGLGLLLAWTVVAIPFLWIAAIGWSAAAVSSSNAALAAGRAPNLWGR